VDLDGSRELRKGLGREHTRGTHLFSEAPSDSKKKTGPCLKRLIFQWNRTAVSHIEGDGTNTKKQPPKKKKKKKNNPGRTPGGTPPVAGGADLTLEGKKDLLA